jgi:serine protease AprX
MPATLATLRRISFVAILICAISIVASAAKIGSTLSSKIATLPDAAGVGVVIVSFNATSGLNATHLNALRGVGITRGITLQRLGMVATPATAGQVRALARNSAVRSVWSNDQLSYFMNQARVLAGVDKVRADANFTRANGGLPIAGQGNFSAVINDTGIDGTHPDLKYPNHVIQNVQIVVDSCFLSQGAPTPPCPAAQEERFTPLLVVENVPNTDTHVGHGTHCAGILGGTGQASGNLYTGVAPGVNLIGCGSGAGLFVLNALGGFEWSMSNQFLYRIRIISNSWGGGGPFDPDDPINIASRKAHDANIIVCFAAGNAGPGPDTDNPYAKAPWVIGVGAGTKEGGLATFSSRGIPKEERLADNDPNNDFDAPTIVAPGTGREFDTNSTKFSARIVSTRSITNVVANGNADDLELPAQFLPFYTQIEGTSMATPFAAGVVALMLNADITLTPDEVKQILQQTATPMPGYEEFEVGSGYVNAYAAVDKVLTRSRNYGAINNPTFNAQLTIIPDPNPETWGFDFSYIDDNVNTHSFTVRQGTGILDVRIDFGNSIPTSQGNVFFLVLTDPTGREFVGGPSLPALTLPRLELRLRGPLSGPWTARVSAGFLGGVAPATIPEHVTGIIKQSVVALQSVPDIAGRPDEQLIKDTVVIRRMDIFADGGFHPEANVTREDFARTLSLNTPLRQSLAATPRFIDVSGSLAAIAEAVTAGGSTLRDWNFVPQGLITATGSTFNPNGTVNRLDLAVAFVRALGLDAEARAKANTVVTAGGQPLVDGASIPPALRGYVQIAIDRGVMEAFPAELRQIAPGQFQAVPGPRFEPNTPVIRSVLAAKLALFAQAFAAGN